MTLDQLSMQVHLGAVWGELASSFKCWRVGLSREEGERSQLQEMHTNPNLDHLKETQTSSCQWVILGRKGNTLQVLYNTCY